MHKSIPVPLPKLIFLLLHRFTIFDPIDICRNVKKKTFTEKASIEKVKFIET